MIKNIFALAYQILVRDFIRVFSGMATGFNKQVKLFELNFFIKKCIRNYFIKT